MHHHPLIRSYKTGDGRACYTTITMGRILLIMGKIHLDAYDDRSEYKNTLIMSSFDKY